MARLALFLLGPPRIERDDVLINMDTRKAVALMAYLVVTRQRHSRDALAALLWPDYDQANARGALRRTLSTLNKALDGKWLEIDRETISLHTTSDLWLDVDNFYALLTECRTHGHSENEVCSACVSPLTEAVKLYRDGFMVGFSLRDSPNFDDWQFFQADSLRRDYATVLERLVACYGAMGDFKMAISYGRRWLALDRLHEPAYRLLMQLYAWAGQRGGALHQYRECVQVLEQELGVAPLAATTQLYQAIKENKLPSLPAPLPEPSVKPTPVQEIARTSSGDLGVLYSSPSRTLLPLTSSLTTYPLVGRQSEWAVLTRAYDAMNTDGHVVIIEGEAGIGKTRLAEDFLARVRTKGGVVISARCYEGETHLAYGPIMAGLRTAIAQQENTRWLEELPDAWFSEVTRLLPELSSLRPGLPAAPPLDSPGAQSRFFEGLRQAFLALCATQGKQSGVLFFDDLHWADGASLDLLTYLLRRLREHPLFLLLTWRSKQLAGDHRLHRLLNEAQRSANATVLSLPRLNQETVRELISSVSTTEDEVVAKKLMERLSRKLAERLYSETEGLPFFLIEYLNALCPPGGSGPSALGSGPRSFRCRRTA